MNDLSIQDMHDLLFAGFVRQRAQELVDRTGIPAGIPGGPRAGLTWDQALRQASEELSSALDHVHRLRAGR